MGLRFCMLTTFYPPFNFGGDGIGVQRTANALVKRGHQVTVIHDVDAYQWLAGRHLAGPRSQDFHYYSSSSFCTSFRNFKIILPDQETPNLFCR